MVPVACLIITSVADFQYPISLAHKNEMTQATNTCNGES